MAGPSTPLPAPRRISPALLVVTALLPGLALLAFDVVRRRDLFVARAGPPVEGYVAGAALSLSIWALMIEVARHPRRSLRLAALAALGLTAALGIGGQLLFHATAHEYFNRDAVVFSIKMWPLIADYLLQEPAINLAVLLGAAALFVGYAAARHRYTGPRVHYPGVWAGLALAVMLFAAFCPFKSPATRHGLPPEVLFLHAAGGASLYAAGLIPAPRALPPGSRAPLRPSLKSVQNGAPSVVLIFGESVRRDEVCARRSADCAKSPRLDATAPRREGFERSFSVASCTEIASAILWSGMPITTESQELQSAPLLWDYARARGYRTGYFTSQNLSFQDQGLFLRTSLIDEKREGRDRDPHVDLDIGTPDEDAAAEALAFLAKEGPAFVVLHFSNTHLPYRQAPGKTPYPADGDDATARLARYRNSLALQDAVIGDFMEGLRKTEQAKSAVVIYFADHGEAWGEHGSYTHTFDLYAEQINVPLWIDAPEGALSEAQRAELARAAAERPVFTADVSATVLDLVGALDEPGFLAHTNKLAGASVLRPAPAPRDMVLSNCPPFRTCYPEAWGIVRWPLKYHYLGRASRSACSDLSADPLEQIGLPASACAELRALTVARHGDRPDSALSSAPSGAAAPESP